MRTATSCPRRARPPTSPGFLWRAIAPTTSIAKPSPPPVLAAPPPWMPKNFWPAKADSVAPNTTEFGRPLFGSLGGSALQPLQLLPPRVKPRQLFLGGGQFRQQFVGLGRVGVVKIRGREQFFNSRYLLFHGQDL